LSLAALSAPIPSLRSRFYDRAREFVWHAGLLFPESVIQTSYLKDLVTAVDPTSKHSFLSFLVAHKRFYSFLTASFPQVTRAEFSEYFAWVSRSLPSLEFDAPVLEVNYQDDLFHVRTSRSSAHARDLVLGTGQSQYVPEFAKPHLGHGVYHSNQIGFYKPTFAGRRVAVIGGGQAGAELVNHFLADSRNLPSSLLWVSRRENFLPLDDSPFTNELFTPEFAEYFYHNMDRDSKFRLLERQKLASDGGSMNLLQDIYRRLYIIRFVEHRPRMAHLLPNHKFTSIRRTDGGLTLRSADGQPIEHEVDLVLLATGHQYRLPDCLEPLKSPGCRQVRAWISAASCSRAPAPEPAHLTYVLPRWKQP
jgi:lysine N6-hydroxylase